MTPGSFAGNDGAAIEFEAAWVDEFLEERERELEMLRFQFAPEAQAARRTAAERYWTKVIRQNHRGAGLVNGDVLTLESRLASGGWVAPDAKGGEQQIPTDFRALAHGYAVTSHKAQGRTASEVIVCAAQLDTKSAYVAFSRGRQQAAAYTPDKTALFDALPDAHQPRAAAVDFWTPQRTDRLHWARRVIERVRQMFVPPEPPADLSVELALPAPKAIATETISRRRRVSYGQS